MKNIVRWGLMRSVTPENIQEHSHMAAVLAHALAVIGRDVYGRDCQPEHVAALALYHDVPEILTGDLPTPIKYHSPEILQAYRRVEDTAADKLLALLPAELQGAYRPLLFGEAPEYERRLVKAADKLCALIKCVEERRAGNDEFRLAERKTLEKLHAYAMDEVEYFLAHFMPGFELTLDEQGSMEYKEP